MPFDIFSKKIFEIIVWNRLISLGGLNQRHDGHRRISPPLGETEKAVLSMTGYRLHISFSQLCEYSHNLRYPQELLIRIFCRKAA